jgi:hypothetical protein
MGRIAQGLIETFQPEFGEINHAAEQLTQGLDESPGVEEMIEEGYDPQHALYIAAHNFASVFAGSVCQLEEFKGFYRRLRKGRKRIHAVGATDESHHGEFLWDLGNV